MINHKTALSFARTDGVAYRYSLGILLVIVLATAISLVGVMGYEFLLWDDNRIVYELHSRGGSFFEWLANTRVTNLFTPVSSLYFGILANVFGITPIPFHAANVLLHLLNTLLVYLLVMRLFLLMPAATSVPLLQPLVAVAVAGLWGMHVLRSEVIGWVAATPYTLSTALALLAIFSFISSYTSSTPRIGVRISLVLYGLSVFAHPQTAPLCCVLLTLDYLLSNQASPDAKARLTTMYFIKRHAAFFMVGLLVMIVGMAVRSSVPVMPFQLSAGAFSNASADLAKLLGFICNFSLFHAWLPLHVSLVYNSYEVAGWLSFYLLASVFFFSVIVFVGIRRWTDGRKGLLLAVSCHMAFCIPAAGMFMPKYVPADRYTYGIAIIAAVVFAFALRSGGELVAKRLISTVSIRTQGISLAGITLMLLLVCLSGLVAALPNWENTHSLMVQLQKTAPSQNWRYFAKLRDADYWEAKGDIPQMQQAIMSFLDAPQGNEEEALVLAVQYLVSNTRCEKARYLARAANIQLAPSNAASLDTIFRRCR